MTDVCIQVANYLATQLSYTLGTNMFYYQLPDEVDTAIVVQRMQSAVHVPIQIDAAVHDLRIAVRSTTSTAACSIAAAAYEALSGEADDGFITLSETQAAVTLYDYPIFDSQDQLGRKVFNFYAQLTTKR